MSDLRSLVIGILGGIISTAITYLAFKGITRYLARRTIRGRQRQIRQLTEEIQLLEKLGVSDRSLLLFAFKWLFPLIGVAAIGVGVWTALPLIGAPPNGDTRFVFLLVPFVIGVLAFYAWSVFRKLEDPEPTLAKLRQKLRDLQAMDDPHTG